MKNAKKIAAFVLAMIMVLALGTVVYADTTPTTGSVTVTNATIGATYGIYKLFDLTYNTDSVTGDVDGVSYTYTKTGATDATYSALVGSGTPFKLTQNGTTNTYAVSLLDSATTGAGIADFIKDNVLSTLTAVDTKTASSTTVAFTGLDLGYYYVSSSLGTLVTIDSTLPDVDVIDKNQDSTLEKFIVDGTAKDKANIAKIGDTVNFEIDLDAYNYEGLDEEDTQAESTPADQLVTYYYIKDTLGDGFTLTATAADTSDIVVKVGTKVLTKDTDYTISVDGNTFEIAINWAEEDTEGNLVPIYKTDSHSKVVITYSATVNDDALLAGDANLNTASFTFDNDMTKDTDPSYDDGTDTTKTYVPAVGIVKTDGKTGEEIATATFIATYDNDTTDDVDPIAVKANATATSGVYEYDPDGTVTEFTTDADGYLIIKGTPAGEYKFTETAAPEGYNVATEASTITVKLTPITDTAGMTTGYVQDDLNAFQLEHSITDDKNGDSTAETYTYTFDAKVVAIVFENLTGTELPSTGGIGTTIFYILGGILLVGAAVLLVTKKRMSAK